MIYSIYKVENIVNGKIYIGFSQNFPQRKLAHIKLSNNGSQTKFHRAIRKYGEDSFKWDIIFQGKVENDILNWAEPYFIREYNTFSNNGYNMTSGGEKGAIQSDEVKKKRSESLSGSKHPLYGKKHTHHSKEKMSLAHKGKNNVRAKTYTFTSPKEELFVISGEFKKFCIDNSLSPKVMWSNVDKGTIQETPYSRRSNLSLNCVGWSVITS